MENRALVVIDLQNDITKNYREIIENVNQSIDWALRNDIIVVYIRHNNLSAGTRTFKPGTRGEEFVPELKIVSDHVFVKSKSNALTSDDFTTSFETRHHKVLYCRSRCHSLHQINLLQYEKKRIHCSRVV